MSDGPEGFVGIGSEESREGCRSRNSGRDSCSCRRLRWRLRGKRQPALESNGNRSHPKLLPVVDHDESDLDMRRDGNRDRQLQFCGHMVCQPSEHGFREQLRCLYAERGRNGNHHRDLHRGHHEVGFCLGDGDDPRDNHFCLRDMFRLGYLHDSDFNLYACGCGNRFI